ARVALDVDEPGRDDEAVRVDTIARVGRCERAARRDPGDPVAADADVAVEPRRPGAVHDAAVQDHDVVGAVARVGTAAGAGAAGPAFDLHAIPQVDGRAHVVQPSALELHERLIPDPVALPAAEVEVPPLELVDVEARRLHCATQKLTVPALLVRAARVVRVR